MGASAHHRPLAAILLVLAPAVLQAQAIYRCGNVYSQLPCTDGIVLDADDRRTADQKAQTDAATTQAMRQADRMERDRLAAERAHAPSKGAAHNGHAGPLAQATTRPAIPQAASKTTGKTRARRQPKEAGDFTASVQQEQKKKPVKARPPAAAKHE